MKDPSNHAANKFQFIVSEQLAPGWKEEIKENENKEPLINLFVKITGQHLSDQKFGIRELLKEMETSRTQLHRKLKAQTGKSAHELILEIKMQKALMLLQSTGLPVAKVAGQTGFLSASHFSKVFFRHFGFLPSKARHNASK